MMLKLRIFVMIMIMFYLSSACKKGKNYRERGGSDAPIGQIDASKSEEPEKSLQNKAEKINVIYAVPDKFFGSGGKLDDSFKETIDMRINSLVFSEEKLHDQPFNLTQLKIDISTRNQIKTGADNYGYIYDSKVSIGNKTRDLTSRKKVERVGGESPLQGFHFFDKALAGNELEIKVNDQKVDLPAGHQKRLLDYLKKGATKDQIYQRPDHTAYLTKKNKYPPEFQCHQFGCAIAGAKLKQWNNHSIELSDKLEKELLPGDVIILGSFFREDNFTLPTYKKEQIDVAIHTAVYLGHFDDVHLYISKYGHGDLVVSDMGGMTDRWGALSFRKVDIL